MFFVLNYQRDKKAKIIGFLPKEPMIAVLLAAANFEWTVSRCILFFSYTPNVIVRERLASCHGLKKYKELWKKELSANDSSIPSLKQVIKEWEDFQKAFNLRHILIHCRGTCTRNMAKKPIEQMLAATDDLYEFAHSKGVDIHQRLPVIRCKKQRKVES
jgi:hypothetical protein